MKLKRFIIGGIYTGCTEHALNEALPLETGIKSFLYRSFSDEAGKFRALSSRIGRGLICLLLAHQAQRMRWDWWIFALAWGDVVIQFALAETWLFIDGRGKGGRAEVGTK